MSTKSSILFVTDKFPWPLDDGGQIRTYQILKSLSRHSRVILVSTSPSNPKFEDPIRALGVEIVTVVRRRPRYLFYWCLFKALFTRRPFPLPKNFSWQMLEAIRNQLRSGKVRALHFNHLDAVQYIHWLEELRSGVMVAFDTHNVLTAFYEQLVRSRVNWLQKAYCWCQWRKMRLYEEAVMRKCDLVIVCSEVERDLLNSWGLKTCLVVPNGVDHKVFKPDVTFSQHLPRSPHLVFTGAMDYFPNAEGVRWFFRSVVPALDRCLPSYKLTIVGKNPPSDLLAKVQRDRVEFTGRVDDVRPYVRSADVFVVPLQIGGGTRLKILEALAMAVPVVSTRVGAEGLDLQDGIHLKLVDNASEMAKVIVELCDQRERARAMAQNGYEEIRKKYTWDGVTASLSEFY